MTQKELPPVSVKWGMTPEKDPCIVLVIDESIMKSYNNLPKGYKGVIFSEEETLALTRAILSKITEAQEESTKAKEDDSE
jgi:hypothetical protein